MDDQFIRNRITTLRIKKQVSERQMSLDLGHSSSYVHSIACGRALPSMTEFIYICEYLGISPKDFFDDGISDSALVLGMLDELRSLNSHQLSAVSEVIKALKK